MPINRRRRLRRHSAGPMSVPTSVEIQIKGINKERDLHVTLTSDTTLEPHINTVTNKAGRTLGLLGWTLKTGAKLVKEQTYKTFVSPVHVHACFMWDPHNIKLIRSQEAVQWRAAHWNRLRHYHLTGHQVLMQCSQNWTGFLCSPDTEVPHSPAFKSSAID